MRRTLIMFSLYSRRHSNGLTIIELMVAMLLGSLLLIAAANIFLSGQRTHRTTEAVNRIQEQQRLAFELMVRDIRHTGTFPCKGMRDIVWLHGQAAGQDLPEGRYALSMMLIGNAAAEFGYDQMVLINPDGSKTKLINTSLSHREGFDTITLISDPAIHKGYQGGALALPVVEHKRPGAPLRVLNIDKLESDERFLLEKGLLIVCNAETAILFEASAVSGDTIHITPGMDFHRICGGGFTRHPNIALMGTDCDNPEPLGPGYCFWGDMTVTPTEEDLKACDEIGQSQAYVYSFMDLAVNVSHQPTWFVTEDNHLYGAHYGKVAEGVVGLTLRYRLRGSNEYVDAATVSASAPRFDFSQRKGGGSGFSRDTPGSYSTAWSNVDSVYLKMRFASAEDIGTDGKPIERSMETYITIRNGMVENSI